MRAPNPGVPPAVHGGLDLAEIRDLGLDPDRIVDFSTNINPFGPAPGVRAAVAAARLDAYPDRQATALRHAIADKWSIPPRSTLVGNGASELLWLVGLVSLRPGDDVLILGPAYSEYARIASLFVASSIVLDATASVGFRHDPGAVAAALDRIRPRVAFVCNPSNPTGAVLSVETLNGWVRRFPDTLFCIDEAYLAFTNDARSLIEMPADNRIVVRSMTKDHALAGVRLGYAVGSTEWIDALAAAQPPWSVSAAAQAAGMAALSDAEHLRRSLERLADTKRRFVADLERIGRTPVPSETHYFLVPVADARAVRLALLHRGILVRDGASFGLPGHLRIATRRPEDNKRLLAALAEVCR
jgi:histidinol-phosphate aminotransferase